MDEALLARDLHKAYGDTAALDGVSLEIDRGEVVALVGPNGAGKTTFVRILTGTVRQDAGTVEVFGRPPTEIDRSRLGVLPQAFSPPERLTAAELLEYYAGLYDDARDPGTVLSEVGLDDAGDTWYERLSGGQKRRACLGAAIVNEPEVVVLDEPTTGIDPAGRRTVRGHVGRLADEGATVLVTTHDMAEAEAIADRVALLADGELVAVGGPESLVDQYGGPARLHVVLDDPDLLQDVDLTALDVTGAVERTEIGLVVDDVGPTSIGTIATELDRAGIEYEELRWRQPDLEAVYMELAGSREQAARGRRDGTATGGDDRRHRIRGGDRG